MFSEGLKKFVRELKVDREREREYLCVHLGLVEEIEVKLIWRKSI